MQDCKFFLKVYSFFPLLLLFQRMKTLQCLVGVRCDAADVRAIHCTAMPVCVSGADTVCIRQSHTSLPHCCVLFLETVIFCGCI